MMDGVGKEASLFKREVERKTDMAVAISEYGRRVSDFLRDLDQSASDYELMLASQRYLLASGELLRRSSQIFACRALSPACSLFEAAAWAYIDSKDLSAHIENLDGRFVLTARNSRFMRSRLKAIAERVSRIRQAYKKEIEESSNPERSAFRLLLEIFLELPVGAWEFAPCMAINGNCRVCGYAVDHGVCAESGSAYDMLSSSREAVLNIIRSSLSGIQRRSITSAIKWNLGVKETPEGSLKLAFTRIESDLCGEYEVVEVCD